MAKNYQPQDFRLQSSAAAFNIPKIKKVKSTDLLSHVLLSDRGALQLMREVDNTCFDPERKSRKQWRENVIYMINPIAAVEERYREKRVELKEQSSGRPLQEVYGFFICKDKRHAYDIASNGISVSHSNNQILGDPSQGVYLYRYLDVALLSQMGQYHVYILVFKVLQGRTKQVHVSDSSSYVGCVKEPTPNYDAHISQAAPKVGEPVPVICKKSQMYVYEYTDDAVPSRRPRQCLPYALIEFGLDRQAVVKTPKSISAWAANAGWTSTGRPISDSARKGYVPEPFRQFEKESSSLGHAVPLMSLPTPPLTPSDAESFSSPPDQSIWKAPEEIIMTRDKREAVPTDKSASAIPVTSQTSLKDARCPQLLFSGSGSEITQPAEIRQSLSSLAAEVPRDPRRRLSGNECPIQQVEAGGLLSKDVGAMDAGQHASGNPAQNIMATINKLWGRNGSLPQQTASQSHAEPDPMDSWGLTWNGGDDEHVQFQTGQTPNYQQEQLQHTSKQRTVHVKPTEIRRSLDQESPHSSHLFERRISDSPCLLSKSDLASLCESVNQPVIKNTHPIPLLNRTPIKSALKKTSTTVSVQSEADSKKTKKLSYQEYLKKRKAIAQGSAEAKETGEVNLSAHTFLSVPLDAAVDNGLVKADRSSKNPEISCPYTPVFSQSNNQENSVATTFSEQTHVMGTIDRSDPGSNREPLSARHGFSVNLHQVSRRDPRLQAVQRKSSTEIWEHFKDSRSESNLQESSHISFSKPLASEMHTKPGAELRNEENNTYQRLHPTDSSYVQQRHGAAAGNISQACIEKKADTYDCSSIVINTFADVPDDLEPEDALYLSLDDTPDAEFCEVTNAEVAAVSSTNSNNKNTTDELTGTQKTGTSATLSLPEAEVKNVEGPNTLLEQLPQNPDGKVLSLSIPADPVTCIDENSDDVAHLLRIAKGLRGKPATSVTDNARQSRNVSPCSELSQQKSSNVSPSSLSSRGSGNFSPFSDTSAQTSGLSLSSKENTPEQKKMLSIPNSNQDAVLKGEKSKGKKKRRASGVLDSSDDISAMIRLAKGLRPGPNIHVSGVGKNPTDDPLPVLGDSRKKRMGYTAAPKKGKNCVRRSGNTQDGGLMQGSAGLMHISAKEKGKKRKRNASGKKKSKKKTKVQLNPIPPVEDDIDYTDFQFEEPQEFTVSICDELDRDTGEQVSDMTKESGEGRAFPISVLGLSHWTEALVRPELDPQVMLVDVFKAYSINGFADFEGCTICQKVVSKEDIESNENNEVEEDVPHTDTTDSNMDHSLSSEPSSTLEREKDIQERITGEILPEHPVKLLSMDHLESSELPTTLETDDMQKEITSESHSEPPFKLSYVGIKLGKDAQCEERLSKGNNVILPNEKLVPSLESVNKENTNNLQPMANVKCMDKLPESSECDAQVMNDLNLNAVQNKSSLVLPMNDEAVSGDKTQNMPCDGLVPKTPVEVAMSHRRSSGKENACVQNLSFEELPCRINSSSAPPSATSLSNREKLESAVAGEVAHAVLGASKHSNDTVSDNHLKGTSPVSEGLLKNHPSYSLLSPLDPVLKNTGSKLSFGVCSQGSTEKNWQMWKSNQAKRLHGHSSETWDVPSGITTCDTNLSFHGPNLPGVSSENAGCLLEIDDSDMNKKKERHDNSQDSLKLCMKTAPCSNKSFETGADNVAASTTVQGSRGSTSLQSGYWLGIHELKTLTQTSQNIGEQENAQEVCSRSLTKISPTKLSQLVPSEQVLSAGKTSVSAHLQDYCVNKEGLSFHAVTVTEPEYCAEQTDKVPVLKVSSASFSPQPDLCVQLHVNTNEVTGMEDKGALCTPCVPQADKSENTDTAAFFDKLTARHCSSVPLCSLNSTIPGLDLVYGSLTNSSKTNNGCDTVSPDAPSTMTKTLNSSGDFQSCQDTQVLRTDQGEMAEHETAKDDEKENADQSTDSNEKLFNTKPSSDILLGEDLDIVGTHLENVHSFETVKRSESFLNVSLEQKSKVSVEGDWNREEADKHQTEVFEKDDSPISNSKRNAAGCPIPSLTTARNAVRNKAVSQNASGDTGSVVSDSSEVKQGSSSTRTALPCKSGPVSLTSKMGVPPVPSTETVSDQKMTNTGQYDNNFTCSQFLDGFSRPPFYQGPYTGLAAVPRVPMPGIPPQSPYVNYAGQPLSYRYGQPMVPPLFTNPLPQPSQPPPPGITEPNALPFSCSLTSSLSAQLYSMPALQNSVVNVLPPQNGLNVSETPSSSVSAPIAVSQPPSNNKHSISEGSTSTAPKKPLSDSKQPDGKIDLIEWFAEREALAKKKKDTIDWFSDILGGKRSVSAISEVDPEFKKSKLDVSESLSHARSRLRNSEEKSRDPGSSISRRSGSCDSDEKPKKRSSSSRHKRSPNGSEGRDFGNSRTTRSGSCDSDEKFKRGSTSARNSEEKSKETGHSINKRSGSCDSDEKPKRKSSSSRHKRSPSGSEGRDAGNSRNRRSGSCDSDEKFKRGFVSKRHKRTSPSSSEGAASKKRRDSSERNRVSFRVGFSSGAMTKRSGPLRRTVNLGSDSDTDGSVEETSKEHKDSRKETTQKTISKDSKVATETSGKIHDSGKSSKVPERVSADNDLRRAKEKTTDNEDRKHVAEKSSKNLDTTKSLEVSRPRSRWDSPTGRWSASPNIQRSLDPDVNKRTALRCKTGAAALQPAPVDTDDEMNDYALALLDGAGNSSSPLLAISRKISASMLRSLSAPDTNTSDSPSSTNLTATPGKEESNPKGQSKLSEKPLEFLLYAKEMIMKKLEEESGLPSTDTMLEASIISSSARATDSSSVESCASASFTYLTPKSGATVASDTACTKLTFPQETRPSEQVNDTAADKNCRSTTSVIPQVSKDEPIHPSQASLNAMAISKEEMDELKDIVCRLARTNPDFALPSSLAKSKWDEDTLINSRKGVDCTAEKSPTSQRNESPQKSQPAGRDWNRFLTTRPSYRHCSSHDKNRQHGVSMVVTESETGLSISQRTSVPVKPDVSQASKPPFQNKSITSSTGQKVSTPTKSNPSQMTPSQTKFDSSEKTPAQTKSDPSLRVPTQTKTDPSYKTSTQMKSDPSQKSLTQIKSDSLPETSTQAESDPSQKFPAQTSVLPHKMLTSVPVLNSTLPNTSTEFKHGVLKKNLSETKPDLTEIKPDTLQKTVAHAKPQELLSKTKQPEDTHTQTNLVPQKTLIEDKPVVAQKSPTEIMSEASQKTCPLKNTELPLSQMTCNQEIPGASTVSEQSNVYTLREFLHSKFPGVDLDGIAPVLTYQLTADVNCMSNKAKKNVTFQVRKNLEYSASKSDMSNMKQDITLTASDRPQEGAASVPRKVSSESKAAADSLPSTSAKSLRGVASTSDTCSSESFPSANASVSKANLEPPNVNQEPEISSGDAAKLLLEDFSAKQISLELHLVEGCFKFLEATRAVRTVPEEGDTGSKTLGNQSEDADYSAFTRVLEDLHKALTEINKGGYGRPNQHIPNDVLLPDEKDKLYTKEGNFVFQLVTIPKSPYSKLCVLRREIEASLQKIDDATSNNKKHTLKQEQNHLQQLQIQRMNLMRTFTGAVNRNRTKKLSTQRDHYSLVQAHLLQVLGHNSVERMVFFRAAFGAIQNHLQIAEKEIILQSQNVSTNRS